MAVWQIETTVTTINTNLSCTVMIGSAFLEKKFKRGLIEIQGRRSA